MIKLKEFFMIKLNEGFYTGLEGKLFNFGEPNYLYIAIPTSKKINRVSELEEINGKYGKGIYAILLGDYEAIELYKREGKIISVFKIPVSDILIDLSSSMRRANYWKIKKYLENDKTHKIFIFSSPDEQYNAERLIFIKDKNVIYEITDESKLERINFYLSSKYNPNKISNVRYNRLMNKNINDTNKIYNKDDEIK